MPPGSSPWPVGTVFELRTARGLAYVQYTHEDRTGQLTEVVRVLPGLHAERPRDLAGVVAQRELFHRLLSVAALVDPGGAASCGLHAVPEHARTFPTFRSPGLPDRLTGVVDWWRFRDDGDVWGVREPLSEEDARVSLDGTAYPTSAAAADLAWDIAGGWGPSEVRVAGRHGPRASPAARWKHVLVFPTQERAREAASALRSDGHEVGRLTRGRHGKRWWRLTCREDAWTAGPDRPRELEVVARKLGGEVEGTDLEDADDDRPVRLRHHLAFLDEPQARAAGRRLDGQGYEVTVRPVSARWVVEAEHPEPATADEEDDVEAALSELAEEHGGRYEGSDLLLPGSEDRS